MTTKHTPTLTFALSLLLAGCASNYPLEEAKTATVSTQVELSSEATYRRMLGIVKEQCFRMVTEAQYFPEAKEGEISLVTRHDNTVKLTWARFEIKPAAAGATVFLIYRTGFPDFAKTGMDWAAGVATPCPY